MMKLQKKTKNLIFLGFLSVALFCLFQNATISPQPVSILKDLVFDNGLRMLDPTVTQEETGNVVTINGIECPGYKAVSTNLSHDLFFGNINKSVTPTWEVAQWDSRADLFESDGSYVEGKTNAYKWSHQYKKLLLGKTGSGYAKIFLGINGFNEYNGIWPSSIKDICYEAAHPALLVQTTDLNPIQLGSISKLELFFKTKVIKKSLASNLVAGWDQKSSTSHFKIHINIQNRNGKSEGHGQKFGLSINYFDVRNRDEDYKEGNFYHRPQQRYMLKVALADLGPDLRQKLHSGMWATVNNVDILPIVKKAFGRAIEQGKANSAPIISENINDYRITSFNFGWEVSSLHDVEMQIADLGLNAYQ